MVTCLPGSSHCFNPPLPSLLLVGLPWKAIELDVRDFPHNISIAVVATIHAAINGATFFLPRFGAVGTRRHADCTEAGCFETTANFRRVLQVAPLVRFKAAAHEAYTVS